VLVFEQRTFLSRAVAMAGEWFPLVYWRVAAALGTTKYSQVAGISLHGGKKSL
jgi:hypothetical protein